VAVNTCPVVPGTGGEKKHPRHKKN